MRVRVMRDFVSPAQDLSNQMRPSRNPLAHHEESRSRSVLIQQIEDPRSIVGVGTVIDRQPDFVLIGFKRCHNATNPLGRGYKQMIQNEDIRTAEENPANRRPRFNHPPTHPSDLPEEFGKEK